MRRLSFSREPAVWVGAIVSVLTVAADFGLHLTRGQWDHIIAAVPLTAAVLIRSQVTPTATLARRVISRTVVPLTKEEQVAKARPAHVPSPGNIPAGPVQVAKPADHTPKKKGPR